MLYAILCYHSEDVVGAWTKEEDDAVMAKLAVVQEKLAKAGQARAGRPPDADDRRDHAAQGPRAAAGDRRAVRRDQGAAPRLLRRRVRVARGRARDRAGARRAPIPDGAYEIRPLAVFRPGARRHVTDLAWIDAALTAARPQALGALLRYFRDLDAAEEAFQEACLRALKTWPATVRRATPRPGSSSSARNAALDAVRRRGKQERAARRGRCSPTCDDAEAALAERLDGAALPRRHPAPAVHLLPSRAAGDAADRAGAAHRLRPHGQADRARLPGERSARWSSASRAPRAASPTPSAVRDAGRRRARRAPRRGRGHDLPRVQRGLFGERRHRADARAAVRGGDPAGAPAAAAVSERARDHGADGADAAAARARAGAVRCRRRHRAARRSGPPPVGPHA